MRCNLCGNLEPEKYFVKNGYDIVRCLVCGLIYVDKEVDRRVLHQIYGEAYFTGDLQGSSRGYLDYEREEALAKRNFARRLRLIERFAGPGKILDVGCALGFFLEVAAERGWEPWGIEISEYAVRRARERVRSEIIQGDFLAMELPPEAFSAIVMFDLLEHVPDSFSYVEKARSLLRPKGVLVVETADLDSAFARLLGRHYHFFTPPDHLTYFSRRTLRNLLEKAGFLPVGFFYLSRWVSLRRILYRLLASSHSPSLQRVLACIRFLPIADLSLPINTGDVMLAVGRKIG